MRIILASQSERRRELLKLIGVPFELASSDFDEYAVHDKKPHTLVKKLALNKARAVLPKYEGCCVIGADTIVYLDGVIIGKPSDEVHAKEILSTLQGRTHTVYTGVAVVTPAGEDVRYEKTRVTFNEMSTNEIDWYVTTGEPLDKAGAYGIQGPGGIFVKSIAGNYFNVIGMPLPLLYDMLIKSGALALNGFAAENTGKLF